MDFEPIEDYGVIGNMRSIALVGSHGSIDFFCFPRFDSPTVFAALLDPEKGGLFCIQPELDGERIKQLLHGFTGSPLAGTTAPVEGSDWLLTQPSASPRLARFSCRSSPIKIPVAPEARATFTISATDESFAIGTAVAPSFRMPK